MDDAHRHSRGARRKVVEWMEKSATLGISGPDFVIRYGYCWHGYQGRRLRRDVLLPARYECNTMKALTVL